MWLTGAGADPNAPRAAWAVEDSEDFRRVRDLPWIEDHKTRGQSLVVEYSDLLRKADRGKGLLKWPQALALDWIYRYRGAYLGLPPGVGKTLITYLAPYVLGSRAPCLVAPASLHRDKTPRDFSRYGQDWHGNYRGPTLVNLEALSLDQNTRLLEKGNDGKGFDLVMIDECDLLRNPESAAFMQLDHYRANSDAVFVLLTGSGMRFGIEDYDTHICWALPNGGAPVPYDQDEREMWRQALATRPKGRDQYVRRPRAGVLLDLGPLPADIPKEEIPQTEHERAQLVVARRINGAPGVLIIDDDDCDQPIQIRLIAAPEDPIIDADFEHFYGTSLDDLDLKYGDGEDVPLSYCLPNEQPCTNGLEIWTALRSLGCGYYSFIDPPPPKEWAAAKRGYARACRSLIAEFAWDASAVRTPKGVDRAFADDERVKLWHQIRTKLYPPQDKPFKPRTAVHKQSDSVIDYACRWMKENEGLVWCASVPMCKWIAKKAGVRYYGAEGRAEDGSLLEDAPGHERAVVSVDANSRGRNLQDRFNTGLIIKCPQSADECHQLFKRYHRFGQTRPVRWDVLITSGHARYGWDMTMQEARNVRKQRRQTQTVLRADIVDCILDSTKARWFRKPAPQY